MRDIKLFLSKALLPLTMANSQAFEEIANEHVDYIDRSVIFTGEFNSNFSSPESELLLDFSKRNFL